MSQTTTILSISPTTFELQDYSTQDTSLISNFTVEPTFDPSTNYVTYFIYDLNGNILIQSTVVVRNQSEIVNSGNYTTTAIPPTITFGADSTYVPSIVNVSYDYVNNSKSVAYGISRNGSYVAGTVASNANTIATIIVAFVIISILVGIFALLKLRRD